jgi:hypothetical protein
VSGPAAPPRRDDGRPSRPPRRDDGRPAWPPRAPRARIDVRALAYPDGAVVERYGPLPARRSRPAPAARRQQSLTYGGVAIASRMAGVALDVSASRFMDRVVRGRVWIGVIAFSLIGLVAMQVSMLKLNSGIGRAVQTISTLERSNSALRSDVTRLSAGERIQPLAEAEGFVMPAPADVGYLRAGDRHGVALRAERRMRAPDPAAAGPAGSATPTGVELAATTGGATDMPAPTTATATAPAAQVPPAGVPAAPSTTALAPAPVGTAPSTTALAPAPVGTAPAPVGTAPAAMAPATGAAVPNTAPPATAAGATAGPGGGQAAAPADPGSGSGGATPPQGTP